MKIDRKNKRDGKVIKKDWKEGDHDTLWIKERKE
jgi:hypothetical protein